jgi:TatD DNase family protein
MLFDTHCHLSSNYEYAANGPQQVLERARAADVRGFVCIGVGSVQAAEEALAIAEREPDVYASTGVHPHDAAQFDAGQEQALRALLVHPRMVAVGEVGLDFHYDHSPREQQREVFRRFIDIARELKKPLIIHTRSAPQETLEILEAERAHEVGGVIHCFSEDTPFAKRALDMGFYISFSGILTFKSAQSVQEVATWAPEDRILVETDSPYLAPVPLRGKPCEPAFVVHTARRLAELRGVSFEHIAQCTWQNAGSCFRLPRLAAG